MRKLLPMMAVAVLAFGMAGPVPAQFSLGGGTGGGLPTSSSLPTTVSMNQMLPRYNINQAMLNGQGGSRTFNFAKMLPNFNYISSRWPLKTGQSQIPPGAYGGFNTTKK